MATDVKCISYLIRETAPELTEQDPVKRLQAIQDWLSPFHYAAIPLALDTPELLVLVPGPIILSTLDGDNECQYSVWMDGKILYNPSGKEPRRLTGALIIYPRWDTIPLP